MKIGKLAAILILAVIIASASGAVLGFYIPSHSTQTVTLSPSELVYSQTMTQTVVALKTTTQTVISTTTNNEFEFGTENITIANELSSVKNLSEQLQLELSLLEGEENVRLIAFAFNQAITIPANATLLIATDANGYNGTLEFVSPNGCSVASVERNSGNGWDNVTILLEPETGGSGAFGMNSTQFAVYFSNMGSSSVTCIFSLIYIYDLVVVGTP